MYVHWWALSVDTGSVFWNVYVGGPALNVAVATHDDVKRVAPPPSVMTTFPNREASMVPLEKIVSPAVKTNVCVPVPLGPFAKSWLTFAASVNTVCASDSDPYPVRK